MAAVRPSILFSAQVHTHLHVVRFDKDGAEILIGRNVILETLGSSGHLFKFLPERYPVYVLAVAQLFVQDVEERLVDHAFTDLFGCNDMGIRGMAQHIMYQVVPAAGTEEHDLCRWRNVLDR